MSTESNIFWKHLGRRLLSESERMREERERKEQFTSLMEEKKKLFDLEEEALAQSSEREYNALLKRKKPGDVLVSEDKWIGMHRVDDWDLIPASEVKKQQDEQLFKMAVQKFKQDKLAFQKKELEMKREKMEKQSLEEEGVSTGTKEISRRLGKEGVNKLYSKEQGKRVEARVKREVKRIENIESVKKVSSLFQTVIGNLKGFKQEMGKLGLTSGWKVKLSKAIPSELDAFAKDYLGLDLPSEGEYPMGRAAEAQINDTSLAMNNILTGQNRMIRDIVWMIRQTIPSIFATEADAISLTKQSIRNAYMLLKAFPEENEITTNDVLLEAGLDPDRFSNEAIKKTGGKHLTEEEIITAQDAIKTRMLSIELTPEEEKELKNLMDQVLNVEPIVSEKTFAEYKRKSGQQPSVKKKTDPIDQFLSREGYL